MKESRRAPWAGLLLNLALVLSTGCASLPPSPRQVRPPRYTPRDLPETLRTEAPEPRHRRRAVPVMVMDARTQRVAESSRRSALTAQLAFLRARDDVAGALHRMSGELSKLKDSRTGVSGQHARLFLPLVDQSIAQLRWMNVELDAATQLSNTTSQIEDSDMRLALLRLGGPRIEATLLGSILLAEWLDFLHLADVVLRDCPFFNVEELSRKMNQWQAMIQPSMTALSSLEPEQVELAAADLPSLTGHLADEFQAAREAVRASAERVEKLQRVRELVEMLTSASAMKMALPRLPPAAPASFGMGLMLGSNGVMMGTRIVVSAEWVEMMRQLVRAGVISLPVVSATVRIHAGQVLMAHAHDDLPRGVREALGDGPEVRGMRQTNRAGAGMASPPRHHVLPREFREWFEQRGFTGDMSIDRFCVKMEQAGHEAIHGGGNWRVGRTWPGEWNQMIMDALRKAETRAGRTLARDEVLDLVAEAMKQYRLPMNFTTWRGR